MAGYAHSLSSSINNGNVSSVITQPLNHIGPTNTIHTTINNGITTLVGGSPAQFYPYQNPPNFADTITSKRTFANMWTAGSNTVNQTPFMQSSNISGKRILLSNNVNYNAPISNSTYTPTATAFLFAKTTRQYHQRL